MIFGLPYDAEVQWLESTGQQFIDTGMKTIGGSSAVNTGYQVEIEYRYTSRPSNDTWVFGYWNNVPSARLYLVGYYNGYRCGAGPDNQTYWCNIEYDSNFHVAAIKNDGSYFDGVRRADADLTGIGAHSDRGLWLFKSEHIDTGGTRQVKYCKMWTIDGELVRDFIPVRFINDQDVSEGAMYDHVTHKLFRNAGTGSFAIGPDVATPVMGLHFMRNAGGGVMTAKDYIQDGLVAMWDGIENAGWGTHDANATVWKDLIGVYDATKSEAVLWGDSYADFTSSTTGKFVVGSLLGKPQTFTFEVVVQRLGTRSGPSSPFSSIEAGGAGFQINRNAITIFGEAGAASGYYQIVGSSYTGTDKTSYSYAFGATQHLYRNATLEKTAPGGTVVRYNNSYPFLIGCEAGEATYSPMSFNGYVFAVRIYNRVLTAEALAANYAVDKMRFGLP